MKKGTRFEIICDLETEGLKRGQIATLCEDVPDYWNEEESLYNCGNIQVYIHRANLKKIDHKFKHGDKVHLWRNHKTTYLKWDHRLDHLLGKVVTINSLFIAEKGIYTIRESEFFISAEWIEPLDFTDTLHTCNLGIGAEIMFPEGDICRVIGREGWDSYYLADSNKNCHILKTNVKFRVLKDLDMDYILDVGDKAWIVGNEQCFARGTLVTIKDISDGKCSVDYEKRKIPIDRLLKDVQSSKDARKAYVVNGSSMTSTGKTIITNVEKPLGSSVTVYDVNNTLQTPIFKVGDTVKIVRKTGGRLDWLLGMNEDFGKVHTIKRIASTGSLQLTESYWYDPSWVELVTDNNNNNNNKIFEKNETSISNKPTELLLSSIFATIRQGDAPRGTSLYSSGEKITLGS